MRVMVAHVPPMLRDILVDAIAREPDMEVMPLRALESLRPRFAHDEPDVIVVGTRRIGASEDAKPWLAEWPHSRILILETSGRLSMMYELRLHGTSLGELSPQQLVEAIRSARPSHPE